MQRYPYQRLLDQLCREDRDPEDIQRALYSLGFQRPLIDDVERLIAERAGEPPDDLFDDENLLVAMNITRDSAALEYVKSAAQLDDDELIDVLRYKFGMMITEEALDAFRKAFWDIDSMSRMDAVLYFNRSDEADPPPDAVPMREAPDYYAWKDGEKVDVDPSTVFDELIADGYFKYKSYVSVATPGAQNEARKWGDFLMKAIEKNRALDARMNPNSGEDGLPDKPELKYDDGGDADVPLIDDVPQPPPEESTS